MPVGLSLFTLRAATAEDAAAIRRLIRQVRINPFGLDWRRFVVAVSPAGELIACGQVKPHSDGSFELASIAVVPQWRRRGAARAIIEHLLATHPHTLYLTCRASLSPLYVKFGFRVIAEAAMPPYFRRLSRLFRLMTRWGGESLVVMERRPENGSKPPPAGETLA